MKKNLLRIDSDSGIEGINKSPADSFYSGKIEFVKACQPQKLLKFQQ
jgi:hypothetical protein